MADKSPDAFRTISEVADDLDLPQHVLRFWETRFTQIKPLKRGGGRRYYRPDDVALITGLKTLLYGQGYTIKGVQRILKEQGVRSVQSVGRGGALPAATGAAARAEAAPDLHAHEAEHDGDLPAQGQGASPATAAAVTPRPTPAARGASAADLLRAALTDISAARNDLARVLGKRSGS
ncbi:MAG: MerR family transcriptional regulator [Hyphomicrobiales bacterium]|nr:MerR family transcriptional regulator [Hyphomicrobiales bacterium]